MNIQLKAHGEMSQADFLRSAEYATSLSSRLHYASCRDTAISCIFQRMQHKEQLLINKSTTFAGKSYCRVIRVENRDARSFTAKNTGAPPDTQERRCSKQGFSEIYGSMECKNSGINNKTFNRLKLEIAMGYRFSGWNRNFSDILESI